MGPCSFRKWKRGKSVFNFIKSLGKLIHTYFIIAIYDSTLPKQIFTRNKGRGLYSVKGLISNLPSGILLCGFLQITGGSQYPIHFQCRSGPLNFNYEIKAGRVPERLRTQYLNFDFGPSPVLRNFSDINPNPGSQFNDSTFSNNY